ncbi:MULTISPECIES: DUF1129 family protein [Saccharibacillus]|uniref:DUF1129 family protein n=1 Tax=Saccharibacillus TaxID=456492 RepID=UPI0013102368|nr:MULTISPECIES: DUF1129 family protein [Saccharibacillus]MWJ31325.1 DUF1129 family protein [Saccharibacillus sp. WB 17]
MSVRKKIRAINKVRDQLNTKNAEYFDEVIVHVRSSRVVEESGEDWLLARGSELIAAQQKGTPASRLFGPDPISYAEAALTDLPKRRPEATLRAYILVPWTALSWTFLLLGLTALFAPETQQVNTGTLLIVILGAIALFEVLMRLIRRDPEEGVPAPPKFNMRGIGSTLIVLIAIGFAGLLLLRFTPVITIPFQISLVIAAIGFIGQFALLRRR